MKARWFKQLHSVAFCRTSPEFASELCARLAIALSLQMIPYAVGRRCYHA